MTCKIHWNVKAQDCILKWISNFLHSRKLKGKIPLVQMIKTQKTKIKGNKE